MVDDNHTSDTAGNRCGCRSGYGDSNDNRVKHNIFNFMGNKLNFLKHFITITKHKYYVFIECWKRGLYWQGIIHDLSKYSFTEFFASARYFQGNSTSIVAEKIEKGYSLAWLNHKAKNKHHWEYWVDFKDGEILLCNIPKKYIVEMCCDMIGASKAYLKGKYDNKEPLNYFLKNKKSFLMKEQDKIFLENLLK